jgi:ribosomal protein S27E
MIHITCQHCTRDIRVADEHAGKKIRCPGCKEVLVLPAAAPAVKPAKAAPAPSPSPIKKAAPPPVPKRRPPEDDDEEIAVAEAVAEDEDDEPRPRKRKRLKRRSRGRKGRYADCPNCDAPGDASPVVFTWWGGMIGPRLLSHVRCNDCGTCYNGSSGKSNDTAILIYTLVSVFISLMILGLVLIATILGH